jgi:hypothetical protein
MSEFFQKLNQMDGLYLIAEIGINNNGSLINDLYRHK